MQNLIFPEPAPPARWQRWYRPIIAGETPIAIADIVELRASVDTLRVAAGLDPIAWEGTSAMDRTFRAGVTPIRAVHFTQLREAIADLWRIAELGFLPEFTGGPIAPGRRPIRVSDPRDLRSWIEQYEAAVPEKAGRAVQIFDEYTAVYPELILADLPPRRPEPGVPERPPLLTEEWDRAGFTRYGYDALGRPSWRLRFVDDRAYIVRTEHDATGLLRTVVYPSDAPDRAAGPTAVYHYAEHRHLQGVETSEGLGYSVKLGLPPAGTDWLDDLLKLADPAEGQTVRVIRDLHGVPVKAIDGQTSRVWVNGAHPVAGVRPELAVAPKPVMTVGWSTAPAAAVPPAWYAVWSALTAAGRLLGTFGSDAGD